MTALHSKPAALPLPHNIAFSSVDVDELENYIDSGGLLERRKLTLIDKHPRVNAYLTQADLNHLNLIGVHLGANVIARSVPLAAAQVVIPVNGNIIDRTKGEAILANSGESAIFHMPDRPVEVQWQQDTSALVVRIPSEYLQAIYQSLTGDEIPEDFSLKAGIDLTTGPGPGILKIINSLVSLSGDNEAKRAQFAGLWEEMLVTSLLTSDPSIREKLNSRKKLVPVYGYVKRTTDYILGNLRKSFSIDELVCQSGVSIRTLQTGFRKTHGQGPMSFVREKKLEAVYRELLRGDVPGVKVVDVASGWGFHHASHFSRIYKKRFRELPSQTLTRAMKRR